MQGINWKFSPDSSRPPYTLALSMMTEAQLHYLENVLGVDPRYFARPSTAANPSPPRTFVLMGPLEAVEKELLSKILGSVRLGDYLLGENVDPQSAHVLRFDSSNQNGRQLIDAQVWWNLPSLKDMLGSGPAVVERKKITWNLLKQLERELRQ